MKKTKKSVSANSAHTRPPTIEEILNKFDEEFHYEEWDMDFSEIPYVLEKKIKQFYRQKINEMLEWLENSLPEEGTVDEYEVVSDILKKIQKLKEK